MATTFLDYNLIARDMNASLNRVAKQTLVARDAEYYKANIGKVSTVDEFLDDYRLYSYAMKAHGLEDMTYAKAFMKKVLESDLTDDASFANKLSDDRYRKFAAAFDFSKATAVAQTDAQTDSIIGLYTNKIATLSETLTDDTRYYGAVIDSVTTVDELLTNSRLKDIALKALQIDPTYVSFDHLKKVLTSDANDPGSYLNTLDYGDDTQTLDKFRALNAAFNFQTDGTLASGTLPQNDTQKKVIEEGYILNGSTRATRAAALLNDEYYRNTIGSVTTVDDIKSNPRLLSIILTGFGLPTSTLTSTFENIVTSDPNDPASYVNTQGGELNQAYKALRAAFNFEADGTIAAGNVAQTAQQIETTSGGYFSFYDDKDDAADEDLISRFKLEVGTIKTVDDLLASQRMMSLAFTAFDIKPEEYTARTLKKVLTSDLNDPASYVNKLGDERLLAFAKAFNFKADGETTAPRLAQDQSEILNVSKKYVLEKSRFGTDAEKKKAEDEAAYYSSKISGVEKLDDFLKDRRLVDFVLTAYDIDPKTVTTADLKKMFLSDPNDPRSAINTTTNRDYRVIVASFNFDGDGKITRRPEGQIQTQRGVAETQQFYLNQTLEQDAGAENEGVRLALYFQRKADSLSSAYDILADPALLSFVQTTFSIPKEMSSADVEIQKTQIDKVLNIKDLQDPEEVSKIVKRFTALYDLANDTGSPALAIFGGSGGISADTLFTLSQLRQGGL
ncbi:Protein of unknown function [Rhizobium sp. RU20A]|uniref:DUF1217 domain-containing protein n=1 Tax=Rhizobium sp. RU20A TaxID=1907412 RepID=UPI0009540523|nr:DUF1217 domain-containing protein [Rhizobium sp. RU20A]SIR08873.1 Protein of unknown function [Rhizobium sp. RU20A]